LIQSQTDADMRAPSASGQVRERLTSALPARAGVSFKDAHFSAIEESAPDIGFFEVHAENFMGAGGPPHARLARLRRDYSLSIHGVGLSIGGAQALDRAHLGRVKSLVERYEPAEFSEHLAWSTHGTSFLNDLLPLPYNETTLKRVVSHVDETQEALCRRILIENPATYLRFEASVYSEIEFLEEVACRTGCGLLLDVNNAYVCAVNHGFVAEDYIDAFPMRRVEEIHLAGYAEDADEIGGRLLIDAHCAPVSDAVWTLYERALSRRGPVATLIEWDNDVPAWLILMAEAIQAEHLLERRRLAGHEYPRTEASRVAVA
jgi:uncharacterized protein (UPF0276 family)